jgi:hypothetical protein
MSTAVHGSTQELQAYWDSPGFQAFNIARLAWEAAHVRYCAEHYPEAKWALREELLASQAEYDRKIAICRKSRLHLAAFGW